MNLINSLEKDGDSSVLYCESNIYNASFEEHIANYKETDCPDALLSEADCDPAIGGAQSTHSTNNDGKKINHVSNSSNSLDDKIQMLNGASGKKRSPMVSTGIYFSGIEEVVKDQEIFAVQVALIEIKSKKRSPICEGLDKLYMKFEEDQVFGGLIRLATDCLF